MTAALSRPTYHKSAKAYSHKTLSITKQTLNEPAIKIAMEKGHSKSVLQIRIQNEILINVLKFSLSYFNSERQRVKEDF